MDEVVETALVVAKETRARRLRPAAIGHAISHSSPAVVPALVALSIGLWGLTTVGLDGDEIATLDASSRSLPDIWRLTGNIDAAHGLYYAVMHLWIGAFGDSPAAVRTPSLLGVVTAAGLLGALGARIAGEAVGLLAGLIYAAAPQISYYAHDARSYGIDTALVIGLTLQLVVAIGSPRRRSWVGYGALAVVTVLMHLLTALVLVAHLITVASQAWHRRSGRPLAAFAVTAGTSCVLLVPFMIRAFGQSGVVAWISPVSWASVSGYLADVGGGATPLTVAAVLLAVGVVRRSPVVAYALPWLLVPPVLLLAYSIHQPAYVFRYLLYTIPALALLTAAGLVEVARLVNLGRLGVVVATVAFIAIVVTAVPVQLAFRHSTNGADDFRGQAEWLEANERPGDAIVFLTPIQREYKSSYPSAYERLDDVGEALTPTQAGDLVGTEVPDYLLVSRLRPIRRAYAIEYWVPAPLRPTNEVLEGRRDALLVAAGLRWAGSVKFRGGYIQIYER